MSCSSAACADALDLASSRPSPSATVAGHVDDDGGVLAGVAVALHERGGQRLDDVRLGAERVHAALGRACRGACAAVGACAVQPARGGGQQALDGGAGAMGRHPGRHGDEARVRDVGALELRDEPLAADARAAHRRAGHEDGQLVGTGAPEHVRRARERTQALGDGLQRGIAGCGATAGVERAEVVDVHQRQRGRLLGAGGVREDRLGVAAERLEGQQPGAGVGAGAVSELCLEAGQPRAGVGQRTAQLMTVAPQQHGGVIGPMEVGVETVDGWSGRCHRGRVGPREGIRPATENADAMVVLGIDPGLANCGYGVVVRRGHRLVATDGGVIATAAGLPAGAPAGDAAHRAWASCSTSTSPTPSLSKHCFSVRTSRTAFAVGQARGVVLLAAGQRGIAVRRLHARSRSRARSAAAAAPTRTRWRAWSRRCCRCREPPRPDHAADALAVAICHANHAPFARGGRGGRGDRARRRRGGGPPARPRRGRDRGRGRLPPGRVGRDAAPGPRRGPRRSRLHTHLVVRDDALALYGFATEEERDLFLALIGVQSVGPKVALAVLSGGHAARARRPRWWPATSPACRPCPASASAPPSGSSSSCARRSACRTTSGAPITVTRGDDPRHIARDGLLELGFQPAEAQELLAAARGRDGRGAARQRAARRPRR